VAIVARGTHIVTFRDADRDDIRGGSKNDG
jgi:hypothetical protein